MSWFHIESDVAPVMSEVASLGGFCDLVGEDPTTVSVRFSVIEFVELRTGHRIPIDDRGFTLGYRSTTSEVLDPASIETLDSLTEFVLSTVLPDDDAIEEDHDWEWLAHQSMVKGVDTSPDELRALEYRVVFSERVHQWLDSAAGRNDAHAVLS